MIDTDKYEGHTPAPWDWFPTPNDSHIGHLQRHSNLTRVTAEIKSRSAENDANAQLIADAPLLLQEVKRLRERLRILNGMNNALWNTVENYDICLDDFTMIDLFNPPKGYEFCEDEERWVKKND